MFAKARKVTSCEDTVIVTDDGIRNPLNPGDRLGYKPGDFAKWPAFGHVWMYIGNGQVIAASGSAAGRVSGKAVSTQNLKDICGNYPLRYIAR